MVAVAVGVGVVVAVVVAVGVGVVVGVGVGRVIGGNEMQRSVDADWLEDQGMDQAAAVVRNNPWRIGQTYYFRLATYAWCGTVQAVGPTEILLTPAAYVADSGRFTNA